MAWNTYESIGYDLHDSAGDMSREDLIEVVCDADYMLMYGMDKEAYEFWQTLPYDQQQELVGIAFKSKTYGN